MSLDKNRISKKVILIIAILLIVLNLINNTTNKYLYFIPLFNNITYEDYYEQCFDNDLNKNFVLIRYPTEEKWYKYFYNTAVIKRAVYKIIPKNTHCFYLSNNYNLRTIIFNKNKCLLVKDTENTDKKLINDLKIIDLPYKELKSFISFLIFKISIFTILTFSILIISILLFKYRHSYNISIFKIIIFICLFIFIINIISFIKEGEYLFNILLLIK